MVFHFHGLEKKKKFISLLIPVQTLLESRNAKLFEKNGCYLRDGPLEITGGHQGWQFPQNISARKTCRKKILLVVIHKKKILAEEATYIEFKRLLKVWDKAEKGNN